MTMTDTDREWFRGWVKDDSQAQAIEAEGQALAQETIQRFAEWIAEARSDGQDKVQLFKRFYDGFRGPSREELKAHVAWPIIQAWAEERCLNPRTEIYDAVDADQQPIHGAGFKVLEVDLPSARARRSLGKV